MWLIVAEFLKYAVNTYCSFQSEIQAMDTYTNIRFSIVVCIHILSHLSVWHLAWCKLRKVYDKLWSA